MELQDLQLWLWRPTPGRSHTWDLEPLSGQENHAIPAVRKKGFNVSEQKHFHELRYPEEQFAQEVLEGVATYTSCRLKGLCQA